jgi:GAF domain-containing protein
MLGVPLMRGAEVIGGIGLARNRVEPFSDKQVELVTTFADQAVIAIENARLLTETREAFAETQEALDQQTATAEVLGVINSSPGDLAPVFEAILEKAHRLCGAAFGILWTYDGGRFEAKALHRVPPALAEYLRQPWTPVPGGTFEQLVRGGGLAHFIDMANSEMYRSGGSRLLNAFVDLAGAQTGLLVPLRRDDTLLGAIQFYRQEPQPFSDKQIALLQNFAAQAVIAMENARLITETREALDQQTATAEVLGVINSSPGDLAPVFESMLDKAMRLCEAGFGFMDIFDGERFRTAAMRLRGKPQAHRGGTAGDHPRLSQSVRQWVLRGHQTHPRVWRRFVPAGARRGNARGW